jgi:hypothetical protein
MMNRIHSRFAFLTLLVAAVAFVVGACDSNGGGANPENSVVTDSLQVANVVPDVGTDLNTTDTSFTFTFTDPVVENEYTRTDVEPTGGNRHLIDAVQLRVSQAKSGKELTPTNSLPVTLVFNDDRTELNVIPEQELQDGFIYLLSVGDTTSNTGFYDARFKSERGARFADNPNLPENLNFEFSVGIDTTRPSVPSVSFNTENGIVNDDGTLAEGALDYTDDYVTVPLRIDEIDDNVKGYEVYYRSQNEVGRSGNGDQFRKAFAVNPEASGFEFEDSEGIIPADAAESGEFGDGTLPFTATINGTPFAADNGSYGPIEWKVRAVSINNVRGEFTEVITTEDNTMPSVTDAAASDTSGNGNDDYITVEFSEPLTTGGVSVEAFTLEDSDGNERSILNNVEEVNNSVNGASEVIISLDDGNSIDDRPAWQDGDGTDAIEVAGDVTDLAGNGVDPDNNREGF